MQRAEEHRTTEQCQVSGINAILHIKQMRKKDSYGYLFSIMKD